MNNCLTTEQILQLAWRLDTDVQFGDHVTQCEACRQQVEKWQTVPEQLRDEFASADHLAEERIRLLESLASLDTKNESTKTNSTSLSDVSREGLAQETARAIREAKSVQFRLIQTSTIDVGGKPQEMKIEGLGYYSMTSGAQRMEIWRDGEAEQISIMFRDRLGVDINHRQKSFRTLGSRAGQMSPLMKIHQLGSFEGKADQVLGEKKIDGVASTGFELAVNKIDDALGNGTVEVWVSKKTHLPVRLHYTMKFGPQEADMVMDKFKWDVKLDESLFSSTPPPGYADKTQTPPSAAEQTEEITKALKLYARLSDGHYPKGKTVYGDVLISALSDKLGLSSLPLSEQVKQESYGEFTKARRGCSMLSVLLRDNPKAAWNGASVTAKDKDKVLLSWQTADGFQVLFGDLKSRSVKSEAELKKLAK